MTILKFFRTILILAGIFAGKSLQAQASDSNLPGEVKNTLKKAALFYHNKVASHGGYVYYYSLDLQQQWGEGKTNPDMIFVQPPGTPTVATAYINAFNATQDSFYLKASREAALALVYGQLESGG